MNLLGGVIDYIHKKRGYDPRDDDDDDGNKRQTVSLIS